MLFEIIAASQPGKSDCSDWIDSGGWPLFFGIEAKWVSESISLRHLDGIERADSTVLDPHKWLFQSSDFGLCMVTRPGALGQCFACVSSTMPRDRSVLRLCTINPLTIEDDIVETIGRLARARPPH